MKRYFANALLVGFGVWLALCAMVIRAYGWKMAPVACCIVALPVLPALSLWHLWRHDLGTEADPRIVAGIVAYCVVAVLVLTMLFS